MLELVKAPTFYAGIGSRKTPQNVLNIIEVMAADLARRGLVLRSGGAAGADTAFEAGAITGQGKKEILLPWNGYNDRNDEASQKVWIPAQAYQVAAKFHPKWDHLSQGVKKLMARNVQIILGTELAHPVSFVICWTEGGKGQGGTGMALRLAEHLSIPIFDLGVSDMAGAVVNAMTFAQK